MPSATTSESRIGQGGTRRRETPFRFEPCVIWRTVPMSDPCQCAFRRWGWSRARNTQTQVHNMYRFLFLAVAALSLLLQMPSSFAGCRKPELSEQRQRGCSELHSGPLFYSGSPSNSAPMSTNANAGGNPISGSASSSSGQPAPVTTADVTTAPVKTAVVTTAPVTTAPVTNAPVTTAPVTTAPVTTAPITTAPVTTAIVKTAPVTTTINASSRINLITVPRVVNLRVR